MDTDKDNDSEEFATINPNLVDFDVIRSAHTGCETDLAKATVKNILLSNDHFLNVLSVKSRATASF